jgi:hypothetical protein
MRTHAKILCVLGLALPGCSGESVPPPLPPPIGSLNPIAVSDAGGEVVTAKERALPDLYAAALSSQPGAAGGAPFSQLVPLLNAEYAEFQSAGFPPAHEPSGIVAAYAKFFGAFDDRKLVNTRVWRTPNEQTIEWVMSGVQARDWNGLPATKKSIAFRGLTLMWTKDDGTISDMHVYFDLGLVRQELQGPDPKNPKLTPVALVPQPTPPSGPAQVVEQKPDDKDQVTVVKAWFDALENNKEADYVAAVTDDIEIDTLESPTPMKGKDEVRNYFRATHRAIGQLDTTVNAAWTAGDYAIVEYDIDGEQLAPITWIPILKDVSAGNTRLAHFDLVDVCLIQGGKIAKIWRYDNPMQILSRGSGEK